MGQLILTNKYQTPLDDAYFKGLPSEIKDQVIDYCSNVEYIKRMIDPKRKRAKDLERRDGRIIVDIANPHILENMSYFTEMADHYRAHGCYTMLKPNGNPNSDFAIMLKREIDRIWHGMVRESDGEWITGPMYFFQNYMPILQVKKKAGQRRADRVVDFPQLWDGIYLRAHYYEQASLGGMYNNWLGGQHCAEIASRRRGKSYMMAAKLARLFVVGDNEDVRRDVKSILLAYNKEFLIKDGTLNKFLSCINFLSDATQFPSARLKDSLNEMAWKMGYIDLNTGKPRGTFNEVLGISTKDEIDKARGKAATHIGVEEFGYFRNVADLHRIIEPSVSQGDYVYGTIDYIGTGGAEGEDFSGAHEMIYNPKAFNIYALPNIYDRNSQGKGDSIYFYSALLDREGCVDKDGNSDLTLALRQLLTQRYNIKYNSDNPMALPRTMAENPITLQEAIMRRDGSFYPIADINERILYLDQNTREMDDVLEGEISASYDFRPSDRQAIKDFPHKDNKLRGAVSIFKQPEKNSDGEVFSARYIAGIDPIDTDGAETLSLFSMFVLDTWTDRIVCEYTGRQEFVDDDFEMCRRVLMYYNAVANYENNKKGLFGYFKAQRCTHLLVDTLQFLRDKDIIKGERYGNVAKGTTATLPVKAEARRQIRDYLITKNTVIEKVNGEDMEVQQANLWNIKARALLKELSMWDPDNNYDRHDAFGMLMLLRQDYRIKYGVGRNREKDEQISKDYLGNDEFFEKNYRIKNRKTNLLA